MEHLANQILEIVKDYRNNDGINLTTDNIIAWANQFGEDAQFMLSELAYILPKFYISKEKGYRILEEALTSIKQALGYSDLNLFLQDTQFLDMQREGKSQKIILSMIDDILAKNNLSPIETYSLFPKKNFVYLDDVLASGKTIRDAITNWLNTDENLEKVKKGEYRFYLYVMCSHTWALSFLEYYLKNNFPGFKLLSNCFYKIENHAKFYNQKFNLIFPLKDQSEEVTQYFAQLNATQYEDYAFRNEHQPLREDFFSSPSNRIKFENLLLHAGLRIIYKIRGDVKPNVRPIGFTNPRYKTLGQGTLFITWRNIPNNCPLALWWDVDGHDWLPLFPPKRQ